MQWLILAIGILVIVVLMDSAPKVGGILLILIVLGALMTASNKGEI
jgi:hypothetical protein